jgi:hypothetical protein
MDYLEAGVGIGVLLFASYVVCCLAFDQDRPTPEESPTTFYERLQRERNQKAGLN